MSLGDGILLVAVVLVSVVLHENAHGLVAHALGDPTAKIAGRLTLNPIPHLDPVGSVILPAFMAFAGAGAFGYAKPVPVTPSKLRGSDRWGFAIVALAGPVSNLVIAFVSVLLLQWMYAESLQATVLGEPLPFGAKVLGFFYLTNVFLAAFNLIPIPPLDGSRLLRPFISDRGRQRLDQLEPYGFLVIFALVVWLDEPFFRVVRIIQGILERLLPL